MEAASTELDYEQRNWIIFTGLVLRGEKKVWLKKEKIISASNKANGKWTQINLMYKELNDKENTNENNKDIKILQNLTETRELDLRCGGQQCRKLGSATSQGDLHQTLTTLEI